MVGGKADHTSTTGRIKLLRRATTSMAELVRAPLDGSIQCEGIVFPHRGIAQLRLDFVLPRSTEDAGMALGDEGGYTDEAVCPAAAIRGLSE